MTFDIAHCLVMMAWQPYEGYLDTISNMWTLLKRKHNEEEVGLSAIKAQHNALTIKIAPTGTVGRRQMDGP